MTVTNKQFEDAIDEAISRIKPEYKKRLDNIAILTEDEVSQEKAASLKLAPGSLLFGLYEGVPLPARNGADKLLPDKITIYKNPHEFVSQNLDEFKERVNHTVWHEVGHYFGLSEAQIRNLG